MCNVTSMSMQLVGLAGGSESWVNTVSADLIEKHGGARPSEAEIESAQPEDLIMAFFDRLHDSGYWNTKASETKTPFYGGWYGDVPTNEAGYKCFHQAGASFAHVLTLYEDLVVDARSQSPGNDGHAGDLKGWYLETMRPLLDDGETATISTKLSGGHFVVLVAVDDDGIRIHDPYGAKLFGSRGTSKGYLKNNNDAESVLMDHADTARRRFRANTGLLQHVDQSFDVKEVIDWGENVFYDWSEVDKFTIGVSAQVAGRGESFPDEGDTGA